MLISAHETVTLPGVGPNAAAAAAATAALRAADDEGKPSASVLLTFGPAAVVYVKAHAPRAASASSTAASARGAAAMEAYGSLRLLR